jgi:hypothetical protein
VALLRRLPEDPLGLTYDRSAVWLGDQLLLSGISFRPNPEGGDEPVPDPRQRLRLAAVSADFTRWTLLPSSDIHAGNLVAVAGRVVYPFHDFTGKEIPGVPGPHYPYGAVLDPASGEWHMLPPPPASRGFPAGLLNVGDRTFVGGHLIDPTTKKWSTIPTPWWSQQRSRTVLAGADMIFVWGGASDDANLADGYLLRI